MANVFLSCAFLMAVVCESIQSCTKFCSCTRTSVECDDASGAFLTGVVQWLSPRGQNNHAMALYITDSELAGITSGDLGGFPDLDTLHVENSWSAKELPTNLLEGLPKLQDLHIFHSSTFSRVGDMLKENKELMYLRLVDNDIPCIKPQQFSHLLKLLEIDLRDNNITEITPPSHGDIGLFSNLPDIALVVLQGNKISRLLTNTFSKMKHLNLLDISRNLIVNIDKQAFILDGESRVKLNLSRNIIEIIPEGVFSSCRSVDDLDLSNNYLSDLHPVVFSGLSGCRVLHLQHNRLTEISSSVFSSLVQLKELDLRNNSLRELVIDQFGASKSLQVLRLSANKITTMHRMTFRDLVSLRELYLDNNRIIELGNAFSAFLPHLLSLSLMKNNLSSLNSGAFSGCVVLEVLHLHENSISEIQDSAFLNNTKLQALHLQNNLISCIKCESFQGLPRLQLLDLSGNPLTSLNIRIFQPLEDLNRLVLGSISDSLCICKLISRLNATKVQVELASTELSSHCNEEDFNRCRAINDRTLCDCYIPRESQLKTTAPSTLNPNDSRSSSGRSSSYQHTTQVSEEQITSTMIKEQQQALQIQTKNETSSTTNISHVVDINFVGNKTSSIDPLQAFTAQEGQLNRSNKQHSQQLTKPTGNSQDVPKSSGNLEQEKQSKGVVLRKQQEKDRNGSKEDLMSPPQAVGKEERQAHRNGTNKKHDPESGGVVHILTILVIIAGSIVSTIAFGFAMRMLCIQWCRSHHIYEEIRDRKDPPQVELLLLENST